jgi:predicted nucleic acid-binding protein
MTLTDTGPLVALNNKNDTTHQSCTLILPSLRAPMLTTWPCFTEAMYLLGREIGYSAEEELWQWRLSGKLRIYELTTEQADRMQILMHKYRDAPMDLADASLVAVAETLSLRTVFTDESHKAPRFIYGDIRLRVFPKTQYLWLAIYTKPLV